tara:strand:+ start:1320 stop:1508 length:189 start_codon:yes stop_codon:yes gene_type:complete
MITIRIIKLPAEALELAKKIEHALSSMIGKAVKTRLGVDHDLKNLEISVYESILEQLNKKTL